MFAKYKRCTWPAHARNATYTPLSAPQLCGARMSFEVVMIYFGFAQTFKGCHYQVLSRMSLMILCHLG